MTENYIIHTLYIHTIYVLYTIYTHHILYIIYVITYTIYDTEIKLWYRGTLHILFMICMMYRKVIAFLLITNYSIAAL